MDGNIMKKYGIDCEKGLKNCIGDLNFYKKILSMFLEDECFSRAKTAYLEEDFKELFTRMHELKGISGNVALTDLYETTVPLVEYLRFENREYDKGELDKMFVASEEAYNRACEGISIFVEG